MPVRPTYPGVYVEEISSGVRPVTAVATSTAAFIGTFRKGLLNEAVQILSMADFEREYGGLERNSEASYAVQQFFVNGGSEAWVVRVGNDGSSGTPTSETITTEFDLTNIGGGPNVLHVVAGRRIRGAAATNPGSWGNSLRLEVEHNGTAPEATFNLTISEVRVEGKKTTTLQSETFSNLTLELGKPNNAIEVVNQGSRLVQLDRDLMGVPAPGDRPAPSGTMGGDLPSPLPAVFNNDLEVTLTVSDPLVAPVTVPLGPVAVPTSFAQWAQLFQATLRTAGADPLVPLALRPYLSGATVKIIGDDSLNNPRRFVVRTGAGAEPFDPKATLSFVPSSAGPADAGTIYMLDPAVADPQQFEPITFGQDGDTVDSAGNFVLPVAALRGSAAAKTGLYALEDVDLFNVLAIPDAPRLSDNDAFAIYTEATAYVESRRAMLIIDIPADVNRIDQMQTWMADNDGLRHKNTAVYFPRTLVPDPLNQNRLGSFAPSGTIAGLWARTDAQRGVWKAPAGTDARLRNVDSLTRLMTDGENGLLNPLGINCLRNFPIYANICWGARTLEGADQLASEWKYVPVRRTTLFIEESLYRGTKWVVFEPNDEPLWAQIRLNVGAFMQDLFRKGAFQGSSPKDAYFVKCDGTTTTQTDIDNGIVNIEVGFAPLKPAEFVILKISQIVRKPEA